MKFVVKQHPKQYYKYTKKVNTLEEAREDIKKRIEEFKKTFEIRQIHSIDEPSVMPSYPSFMDAMPKIQMTPPTIEFSCIAKNCTGDGLKFKKDMYICRKCVKNNNYRGYIGNDIRHAFMIKVDDELNSLKNGSTICNVTNCNRLVIGDYCDCKHHQRLGIVNGIYTFKGEDIPK